MGLDPCDLSTCAMPCLNNGGTTVDIITKFGAVDCDFLFLWFKM